MARKRAGISPWVQDFVGAHLEQLTDDPMGPHRVTVQAFDFVQDFSTKQLATISCAIVGSYPHKTKRQKILRRFNLDPSLENYAILRSENPTVRLTIKPSIYSHELSLMKENIEQCGLDFDVICSAIDGDDEAISSFSLDVMTSMIESKIYKERGHSSLIRRQLAPSDAFVDYLCSQIIVNYTYFGQKSKMNSDFLALLTFRLSKKFNLFSDKQDSAYKRDEAKKEAGRLLAMNKRLSVRSVAKAIGVAPSSVSRWFAPGELLKEAQRMAKNFDSEGQLVLKHRKKSVAQE